MSKHSPAFQFYANDWLSSPKITLMTPAQEGAYIRLLAYAWADPDCSLPDDDDELASLSRLGEEWFKGGSTKIRKCFEPHSEIPGRLVNKRLIDELEKQKIWREKSSIGGRNSGEARRNKSKQKTSETVKGGSKKLKGGSRVVEPNTNISSSSSSSSSCVKSARDDSEQSPILTALETIYPGSATNFQTMAGMFELVQKLGATAEQVLAFPGWMENRYRLKANTPFAFRDLFPQSLQDGNGHHANGNGSKPKTKRCPECDGKGAFFLNRNSQEYIERRLRGENTFENCKTCDGKGKVIDE